MIRKGDIAQLAQGGLGTKAAEELAQPQAILLSQHSSERQSLPRNSVASSSTLDRNLLSFLWQL